MNTCLDGKREEIEARLAKGESLRRIAISLNLTYQALQYHRRIWGCAPLRKARTTGKDHASWQGGFFIDRWGYKMIRSPNRQTRNPYTAEHVLIAENSIGRQIKRGEHVHHLNGDKTDNRPENLRVVTASQHRILHRQLEELAMELVKRGDIVFRNNRYSWA